MCAPGWTSLCDFDGTISVEHVIDSLLDRFGHTGWEVLEQDWRAGRIGSCGCMAGQVELLQVSCAELDAHLAQLWIDHAIHRILGHYGLDGLLLAANHLEPGTPPQQWRLTSPFQVDGCSSGTCKCACEAQARSGGAKTLPIGDSASDFCAADRVDFVFAKHRLIEHCRAAKTACVPITGFEDALGFLPQLLNGSLFDGHTAMLRLRF